VTAVTASLLAGTLLTAVPAQAQVPVYQKGTPPLSTPWTAGVGPDNALPEYPRPQLTRDRWQNLNGVWQFEEATRPGEGPPFGRELPERILVPYPVESALSGIQRSVDRMWYRRTVEIPAEWDVASGGANAQRLLLHFGAVDYDTTVHVNGRLATTHRGGYDEFSVDVTDLLERSGPQEIVVGVEDLTDATSQPVGKQRERSDGGIFYQGSSGIWQTVWMEPAPAQAIGELRMTPDLATSTLALTVPVPGATDRQQVEAVAVDRTTGAEVGRVSGAPNAPLVLPVPGARLWSPDSPTLYDLRVRLVEGDREVDAVGSYFGMRSVGVAPGADGRNRLTLNGEILFHNSTLDQGFWPDGLNTAPTDAALRFDLELHKRLGFNTVRKHIKVEPDRWYHHADTLGLMVWQDMPAMRNGVRPPVEAQEQYERELDAMVAQKRNWTSIVGWVPFNEGWGEWSREATGRIADEVGAADPSRLVNAHSGVNCCESLGDSGRGDVVDFHQYVGPAAPEPDAARASMDGEHGGLGLRTPGHEWFTDGRSFAYEITDSPAALTRRYVEVAGDLKGLADSCGISGSVYTQLTDVEAEINGLVTYDRRVEKLDFAQVRAINEEVTAAADGTGRTVPAPGPGTPGPTGIGYWPADEGAGPTAADSAGDADLTLSGGTTWTAGRTGAGLQFDGADDAAATTGPVLDTRTSFSVSAWVKLDRIPFFATAVAQDGRRDSTFFLQHAGPENRFSFSTTSQRAIASAPAEVGRWYHLVGTRDAATGTYTLYVDGQAQGSFTTCRSGDGPTGPLTVGRGQFGGEPVDPWPGAIDEVRAYDRALSPAEVAELHAFGR
jgi:hypothetical protein